jgi:hypothetical protein
MHLDAEPARDRDDLLAHFDVGARRRRISCGVLVYQATPSSIAMIYHLSQ